MIHLLCWFWGHNWDCAGRTPVWRRACKRCDRQQFLNKHGDWEDV